MGYSKQSGWNGSRADDQKAKIRTTKQGARTPSLLRGVIALVAVLLIGGLAFWLTSGEQEAPKGEKQKPEKKQIKVVDPSLSSLTESAPTTSKEKIAAPEKVVDHPPTNQWGNPWHWGPNKKLKPAHVSRLDRKSMPLEEQIFPRTADRAIAGLLVIEPGADLIGGDEFGESFVRSFKKSLEDPVKIEPDDTEEAKELKRAVLEVQKELKQRMDAGEDIAQIMTDTRRELRELGAYRQEIMKQVENYRKKGDISSEDMRDMVDAANSMLNERGLKPIVMPEFYYQHIDYRNRMRKAREQNGN